MINLNIFLKAVGWNLMINKIREVIKNKIPTGEFGTPEQIYNSVKFLIETSYINGSSIDVNGGAF